MGLAKEWFYALLITLLCVAIVVVSKDTTPTKPIKKPCPHYVTVKTIASRYDHWAGTIVTLTMEDGGTYQSDHHQVTNYVGQKICSTELDNL